MSDFSIFGASGGQADLGDMSKAIRDAGRGACPTCGCAPDESKTDCLIEGLGYNSRTDPGRPPCLRYPGGTG